MQALLNELSETRKAIENIASQIMLLQQEVRRLQRAGRDASEVRAKLAELHTVHMLVLAMQQKLRLALKGVQDT